jgi:CheY-like chemotaxis protein
MVNLSERPRPISFMLLPAPRGGECPRRSLGLLEKGAEAMTPLKILVVEDHHDLAEVSCRVLRDLYGHEVRTVDTGAKALQAAGAEVPDLVLVDIKLPDMSGYDVARRLRANPGFDHTLLVALTGYGAGVDEVYAREIGFDASFRKPLDFDLLVQVQRGAWRPAIRRC